jgi:hypothetical protein
MEKQGECDRRLRFPADKHFGDGTGPEQRGAKVGLGSHAQGAQLFIVGERLDHRQNGGDIVRRCRHNAKNGCRFNHFGRQRPYLAGPSAASAGPSFSPAGLARRRQRRIYLIEAVGARASSRWCVAQRHRLADLQHSASQILATALFCCSSISGCCSLSRVCEG